MIVLLVWQGYRQVIVMIEMMCDMSIWHNFYGRLLHKDMRAKRTWHWRSAKKFKRDASLLDFEAGAKFNRETLLATAQKYSIPVTCFTSWDKNW